VLEGEDAAKFTEIARKILEDTKENLRITGSREELLSGIYA